MAGKKSIDIKASFIAVSVVILFFALVMIFAYENQQPKVMLPLDSTFNATTIFITHGNTTTKYGAYLALTQSQQQQGYMNQSSLGDCKGINPCIGMLFVFNNSYNLCFWMKNTELPLTQAWVAQNGTITYVAQAQPYSTNSICAAGSMVLETSNNQALSVGDKIKIS